MHHHLLTFAAIAALVSMTGAHAQTVTTATTHAGTTEKTDGSSASRNDTTNAPAGVEGTSITTSSFASPGRLSVSTTSTGFPFKRGGGASFVVSDDTTFNYQPGFGGQQSEWVEVGLTGVLSGTIQGTGLGGTGFANARVWVSGNLYTADPADGGVPLGGSVAAAIEEGGSVRSFDDSQTISVTEFVSTGYFWVRRGETVSFGASLGVEVFSDRQFLTFGTVSGDFSDTLEFDPAAFFDIRTPGVTANAPSFGLVNNQVIEPPYFQDDFEDPSPPPIAR